MQMIEIGALENGAHRNQTYHGYLPEGWALVGDGIEIPGTFPFVDIEVEEVDGVATVVRMTAGIVPEPVAVTEPPEQEAEEPLERQVAALAARVKELESLLKEKEKEDEV